MKRDRYFLVALDEIPRIIHLDTEKLNEENSSKLYNIAYLDYLISRYDEKEIRDYLFKKGIIKYNHTPLFIVHPYTYRKKLIIKFMDPIFKSDDNIYLDNIALTTIRKRALSLSDVGYMLYVFEEKFYNDLKFQNFVHNMIDEHDLKYLLNYRERKRNGNYKRNISYNVARTAVNCIYQYDKCKSKDAYLLNSYGQYNFYDDTLRIIEKELENLKIKDYELNEFDVRKTPWDNKVAEKYLKEYKFDRNTNSIDKHYIDVINTLTLEDRYHAGFISYDDYLSEKQKGEKTFHK